MAFDSSFPRALSPTGLVLAALFAMAGALAGGVAGAVGVAACAALALLPLGRLRLAAMCALPAALAAWPAERVPCQWPATGPVEIDAVVAGPVSRDRPAGRARCMLSAADGTPGARLFCRVTLPADVPPDALLPGDRVRGRGFLEYRARDLRDGRPPLVRTELDALTVEHGRFAPGRLANGLRFVLEDALMARLHGDAARLCCHLVLGDGPELPDRVVAAHRATGLAHLLAVSGAHASMLAWLLGLAYRLARGRDPWSARGYRRVCGVILLGYGAVTGWEPPVFRALVAFLVAAWAAARGRRTTVAAALALPALLTAWTAPADLARASFWLSYAAVIGLSAAGAFGPGGPWQHAVRTALRASCWTLATTAPLALLWFGQLAPWTVLGTPLCAPLVGLMLALGLLTATFGVVLPPVADALAPVLQVLSDFYAGTVELLATLPAAPIHAPWRPAVPVLVGFALAGALPLALRPTRRRLLIAVLVPCVPFFVPFGAKVEARMTLCDVGHGQACVVALGDAGTVVVDCGAHTSGSRAARAVVAALPARRRVDVLVLSHSDADHTCGVPDLLTRVAIGRAVLPAIMRRTSAARALRRAGVPCRWIEPGESVMAIDGVVVSATDLDPATASDNDASLWVRVSCGGMRVVLPGDAEARGIARAIATRIAAPADVLVLPHHGRGPVAANRRLVHQVKPTLALCSHGDAGDAPLMPMVRACGVRVIGTSLRGRIDLWLDGRRLVACEYPERTAARAGADD